MKLDKRYEMKQNSATKKFKIIEYTGRYENKVFSIHKKRVLYTGLSFSYAEKLLLNLREKKK